MNLKRCCLLLPRLAGAALMLTWAVQGISEAAAAKRPNVIIVVSDDQGYGDFSCHGNPVLKTPNFDKLYRAERPTHRFPRRTDVYANARRADDRHGRFAHWGIVGVCGPFVHPPRHPDDGRDLRRRRISHRAFWQSGISATVIQTCRINAAFRRRSTSRAGASPRLADVWQNDYFDGHFRHNGVLKQYPGYCTDVWFNLAMDWMRKRLGRRAILLLSADQCAARAALGP